ncbi:MAG TPA: polysaccharide biosynthesis tyrosine autokinase [Planctomycetes bacterium]|nr:polysaccharide biosynthesis tyrosine autokinase [Planctomycetota bacterium]
MSEHGYGGHGPEEPREESLRLGDLLSLVERRMKLILATAALVVVGTFVYLGMRPPTYRASATLMLLDNGGESGLLANLSLLESTPAAAREMALLSSRSLIETTAGSPASPRSTDGVFEVTPPDSMLQGDSMRRLGLETRVEAKDLTPFATLWRKLTGTPHQPHRLFASASGPIDPRRLTVSFPSDPSAGTVRVRDEEGGEEVEVPYRPDEPFAAFGLSLRLRAIGAFAGQTYEIERFTLPELVDEIEDGLSVHETARNSGVISLTIADHDPNRAAELANALCQNYIQRSIRIGRYRASQTVTFVSEQLAAQEQALREAEDEVVQLQSLHPETIDVSAASQAWIDRVSDLELRRTQAELARTALGEAIALLREGKREAIARLAKEVPDLESLVLIQEVGRLSAEALLLDRRDSGEFRLMLEQELNRERHGADETRLVASSVRAAREGLLRGDAGALARLADPKLVSDAQRAALAELDAELARLSGVATEDNPDVLRLEAAREDLLARLASELESAETALTELAADRDALADSYAETLGELPLEERGKVDAAVRLLEQRILGNLESRLAGINDDIRSIDARIAGVQAELAQLPEEQRRLADPLRRVAAYGEIVRFLLKSQQEAQLSEAATLPSAVLIDPAKPPRFRSSPRLVLSLIVASILGLAAGLLLAFLRQNLAGCMYSAAELEEASSLPVFGAIPDFRRGRLRVRGAGDGYLAMLSNPGSPVGEAYRSIRSNLKFALEPDSVLRTVAVTSSAPGEGKTTTNANLAATFALGGAKVLLVDADVRRPAVHKTFGLEKGPGFAEALMEEADWRECVHRTELEGLAVLCCGSWRGTPGEALSGERPAQLIDEFLAEYDVVLFDLPPAVVVADVEAFAHKLDAIVLLYRAGGVPREVFQAALRRLKTSRANLVGAILNAVRPTRAGSRSYYGYGYENDED